MFVGRLLILGTTWATLTERPSEPGNRT